MNWRQYFVGVILLIIMMAISYILLMSRIESNVKLESYKYLQSIVITDGSTTILSPRLAEVYDYLCYIDAYNEPETLVRFFLRQGILPSPNKPLNFMVKSYALGEEERALALFELESSTVNLLYLPASALYRNSEPKECFDLETSVINIKTIERGDGKRTELVELKR